MKIQSYKKEGMSRAYVQAISAAAGISISLSGRDHDYGIDGTFHQVSLVDEKRVETGYSIDFQLKATSQLKHQNGFVKYDLDANTQRALANRMQCKRTTPVILIVLDLPEEPEKWLEMTEKNLILRYCCFWTLPIWGPTSNSSKVTIEIPKNRVLSPSSLQELMREISSGEALL